MKNILLIPLCLAVAVIAFYGYHVQPKLVKEVIWSPELLEIAPDGVIYNNETAQKFFEKQSFSPPQNRYYGKNQWNPLILRDRKIKKLSGNCFDTNDVKLEFFPFVKIMETAKGDSWSFCWRLLEKHDGGGYIFFIPRGKSEGEK